MKLLKIFYQLKGLKLFELLIIWYTSTKNYDMDEREGPNYSHLTGGPKVSTYGVAEWIKYRKKHLSSYLNIHYRILGFLKGYK